MATPFFRFGTFRLDPLARELFDDGQRVNLPLSTVDCLVYLIRHRDRPVGRDELASAVWGRVDVSEVSLSHAIMRLRKLLGDDGNAQRAIRTVPRLGYRWVMEVESDATTEAPAPAAPVAGATEREPSPALADLRQPADAVVDDTHSPIAAPGTGAASPQRRPRRPAFVIASMLAVLAAVGLGWWALQQHRAEPETSAPPPGSAMVLPAKVDASAEWSWLKLGLMDLVATQLRRGALATTPSETVVALVKARGDSGVEARVDLPAALLIEPTVTHAQRRWQVRLIARGAGRDLEVTASADDAISAGRSAADELLIKLGHTPPADDPGDAALALATLRQRINAAVLAGQLDVARRLIADASPALQASPEIVFAQAKVDFFAGDYEGARARIQDVLPRLPADESGVLRARALSTLGATFFRLGRVDEADAAYTEAARLLEGGHEPDSLAKIYIGLGGVASQRLQLDRAATDYGHARTLLEMGNDAFGVAAVDLNLGMNAMQRGQPATALPILRDAATRFARLAAEDALAATRVALVDVELALLDHAQALAVSDDFEALASRAGNQRQRWELILARADALAASGRLAAAEGLVGRVLDDSDAARDAVTRAQANALAATIALARGDAVKAAEFGAAAVTHDLDVHDPHAYAAAWRVRIEAMQRSGDARGADIELAKMRAWRHASPGDAGDIDLALAEALRYEAAGDRDHALERYAAAMRLATARGVPLEIVDVGQPYVRSLIAAGRLDEAVAVNGRVAPFADRDVRAAWTEALVYTALKQPAAAARALERARRLAGERSLADVVIDAR